MNRLTLLLACLLLLACGETIAPTLPKGRCVTHGDCQPGLRCNAGGYCEDIYHPDVSTGRPKLER